MVLSAIQYLSISAVGVWLIEPSDTVGYGPVISLTYAKLKAPSKFSKINKQIYGILHGT